METFQTQIRKPGVMAGIILSLSGTGIYVLGLTLLSFDDDTFFRVVLLNLVLAFLYSVFWVIRSFRMKEPGRIYLPFVYLLWFISCFSCNLLLNVFENLPPWVYLLTALFCLSAWVLYWDVSSSFFRNLAGLVNGISTLLIIYYAVYLLPLLPYSLLGILAFGLGFHGLVPGIVLLLHGICLYRLCTYRGRRIAPWLGGIFAGLLSLTVFILAMQREAARIREYVQHARFASGSDLPEWVIVSQRLQPGFMNEILLKQDLVYTGADHFFSYGWNRPSGFSLNYTDRKIHDPFFNTAFLFTDNPVTLTEDRIRILESVYGNRLQTEQRLWSGQDIETLLLSEDVLVYPELRLAYTELSLELGNRQRRNGEAIYSFLLPEGSVASSLSLWVNGVERKAVLASKSKARQAYDQVVGVEFRDPALLQWREGNRVVVRIFPVHKDLPRRFKIGISTPLQLDGDRVRYRSVGIQGPGMHRTDVRSRVRIKGGVQGPGFGDAGFEEEKDGFVRKARGVVPWQLSFAARPLEPQFFAWEGQKYLLQESVPEWHKACYEAVVLDLNASWKKADARRWVDEWQGLPLYILTETGKQRIGPANFEELWQEYSGYTYTLPPLYLLNPGDLLITSSGPLSPNLDELSGTPFLDKIYSRLKDRHIRVLNTGAQLSPFWQTLREQRYVQLMNVSVTEALELAGSGMYPEYADTADAIHIQDSGLSLSVAGPDHKAAESHNDHIYRLYAYGKVLQQYLAAEEDTSLQNTTYIALAEDAHIVTPLSSMLVLETDADYTRTGLAPNVDTLGNASAKNDGAVPEPHEWALIILAAGLLILYIRKNRKRYAY